ncbi:MAG: 4'-phosphopantetheinyl transferase superfamily protein [Rikenellaceae bacterium]
MKTNIIHDIETSYSRIIVCDMVTNNIESNSIEGCLRRKEEWHTTRVLLKEICPQATIRYGESGDPILEGSDKYSHISISHGAGKVAILLSNNLCGIDIESKNRHFDRIATRFLNEKERSIITKDLLPSAWSAKEAIFKYFKGKDIKFLSDFEITNFEDDNMIIMYKDTQYRVSVIDCKSYVLAYIAPTNLS